MTTTHDVLTNEGLLSRAIPGFTPRAAQQEMAEAISKALENNAQIIIEAGTGTGKTFGYLVPILLSQKKTIISTGTKTLQDQLFFKDLPVIKKILALPTHIVLLKGRANYLCKQRLEQHLTDGRFASPQLVTQLHTVHEWVGKTRSGDIAELADVPEDSSIWQQVTSTADNCLGQDCHFYKECFVVKARQQALAADIVVVNHYLFFADSVLQTEGVGELLPGVDAVVFDEAHHLPEIASQFFSTSFSSRQLLELGYDTQAEVAEAAKDMPAILEKTHQLPVAVQALRAALGADLRRALWPNNQTIELKKSIQDVKAVLAQLEEQLKVASVRSKGLENCWRRSIELTERFNLLTDTASSDKAHWFETYPQNFTLQLTPIIVADLFKKYMEQKNCAWVFTSATLTVQNNFRLFVETLGLTNALQLQLLSPFDYAKQALLYVPRGLPDPHSKEYIRALIEAAIPVLEITQGKTFLLFTSFRAMEQAAELLKDRITFPILLQGSMPKKELIDQFKALGNAVLLGTSSFWYGVDVRGEALSCVIIDKLPFAAPDDPILKARIQMLRQQGSDPFYTLQLPNAIVMLNQGAGRLIRDVADRGVLMIGDPRLVGSRYGAAFLQSLPKMSRTREFDKVRDFFEMSVE